MNVFIGTMHGRVITDENAVYRLLQLRLLLVFLQILKGLLYHWWRYQWI